MVRRYLLTLFSTLLVLGVYSVYAQVSKQLLKRPRPVVQQQTPTPSNDFQVSGPRISQEAALKYLPDAPWTMNARVKIHADGLHLFFNERVQENGNKEIRIRPVAMIWDADADGKTQGTDDSSKTASGPITILADSATFVFDKPVELSDIKMHMLQEGMLRGKVIIRGEDGLKIAGNNFVFSRAAQHLRSDDPVHFQFQHSEGQAGNILLKLKMLDGPLYRDNPQILGISHLRTSGHLEMALVSKQGSPPVIVNCERSFDYQVDEKLATLKEDVSIIQIDEQGYTASIDCDKLKLQFVDAVSTEDVSSNKIGQPGSKIEIGSMRATGSPVVCSSQKQHLQAKGRQLDFDFIKRVLIIKDLDGLAPRNSLMVDIKFRETELKTPQLKIHLDDKNKPIYANCDGPGILSCYHKQPQSSQVPTAIHESSALLKAEFNESLTFEPSASATDSQNLKVITLNGNAIVRSPEHHAGMIADKIRLLLEITDKPEASNQTRPRADSVEEGWLIRKAIAEGNVAVASSPLEGEYETLTLNFEERSDHQLATILNKQPGQNKTGSDTNIEQASAEKSEIARLNMHVDAKQVSIDILHNHAFTDYHIAHVETSGNVLASGKLPDAQEHFQVQGQGVEIENAGDQNQQFRLLGTPRKYAFIQNGSLRIEGIELFIDTAANFSRVFGPGSLQFPVNVDMEGNKLQQMQLMEVFWSEQMKFKGGKVHFIGKVRAVIQDSVINCEQLIITLDQPVSFQNPDNKIKPQIKEIECTDGVKLEMNQFEKGKLIAVRLIDVATFKINHFTGDMQAQGPGEMNFWQRRNGKTSLGMPEGMFKKKEEQDSQKSNSPKSGWDYTKVTFAGYMKGNIDQLQKQGRAAFHDRVNVLHGPVSAPLIKFTRDNRPLESAWMRCELLEIQAFLVDLKKNPQSKSTLAIEFKASKNAEIEGDQFQVRANIITFDQARNLFVMRGEENRHVTLWRYKNRHAPREQIDLMMVTISPDGKVVKLDRILGASGSQ